LVLDTHYSFYSILRGISVVNCSAFTLEPFKAQYYHIHIARLNTKISTFCSHSTCMRF